MAGGARHQSVPSRLKAATPPICTEELYLEGVPPSVNRWSHDWKLRNRAAKLWRQKVWINWLQRGKPKFSGKVIVLLEFTLKHGGDADNRIKFALDGLVGTYLEDDSPEFVEEIRVRSCRGKVAFTKITIMGQARAKAIGAS